MSTNAYINRIATAVPDHDVHRFYLDFAARRLADRPKWQAAFTRMADVGGIEHRYSTLEPALAEDAEELDRSGFCVGGTLPTTAGRMRFFEELAPGLAKLAVDQLELGADAARITHLIVITCTGLSAPGIDLNLIAACGLPRRVERTTIGFMGCYAAITGLKLARHIVRSEPGARVLLVNIELCTLHLRETTELEKLLCFCLWGDGCAATLVTAEPVGIRLDSFHCLLAPERSALMSWSIRDDGFEMVLSGQVPGAVAEVVRGNRAEIVGGGVPVKLWAVHPGGRSILDAVERALQLPTDALAVSREVLRRYGNMSSATVMFVMAEMLKAPAGLPGVGMAFGPGLTAEIMRFGTV